LLRITLTESRRPEDGGQRSEVGSRIFILTSGFRDGKHFPAKIQSDDFRATLCERKCDVAGATAQIERAVSGFHSGKFGDAAFPVPVEAEALEIVEQIVAPGNGGEEVFDLRGALFTRSVKHIAHGDSLADWLVEKSKSI
jgi:hypothetical protein